VATTILAFFEYLITLFLLVMVILYVPLTLYRVIANETVRRKGLIALGVTVAAAVLIWVLPNGGWHWSLQFGMLAVLSFVALNFHAALRLIDDCPLPGFDRHLLIATIVLLTVGFIIPDLGIKGAMALVSGFVLGG
jgi:hypothetical protein